MKSNAYWLAMAASFILFGVSCVAVREVTEQERADSFKPLEELRVGSESIRNYALGQTAVLFGGAEFAEIDHSGPDESIFNGTIRGDINYGTAVPVDRRGYFVTAAHCVEGQGLFLAFTTKTGTIMREARVVYRGDPSSLVSDFAILHVSEPLHRVFKWGSEFRAGDAVISTGVMRKQTSDQPISSELNIIMDPVGGRIEKVFRKDDGGVAYQIILHDSPMALGNSGGPLLDRQGRLLAINITGAVAGVSIFYDSRFKYANAVRPDLKWLARVIERDAISAGRDQMGRQ